jgi:nicotinamidase-related amidase
MSTSQRPQFASSALLVVDMQNDFLHPEGYAFQTRRSPEAQSDMSFLTSTIPQVKRVMTPDTMQVFAPMLRRTMSRGYLRTPRNPS